MSELNHSFQELRDDLRSTITPPDLDQVVGRARQRSVRRRMQVGAIAAVVAVSVAVPALRTMPENPTPAGPPAAPVTYQVDFADADHGYALESVCDGPCTFTLLATTDGGRGWQPRQMPEGEEPYRKSELLVVGPEQLVIHLSPVDPQTAATGFFSTDAGRTWRKFNALALTEPSVIPPGATLHTMCTEDSEPGKCTNLVNVFDAAKGAVWAVPTQPALVAMTPGPVATAGGEFWVTGRDPATGQRAIAVTSDGGRTWATNPLDVQGEPTRRNPWSVVEHDGTLYLTVVGSVGNNPVELLAVFRSTDRGQSWTRTWQPTAGHRLLNVFGDAVATADGRLLVYSTTEGTLESKDGRTFTKAERQLAGPVTWTRGGYLAKGADGYEISRDGLDWRRFELP